MKRIRIVDMDERLRRRREIDLESGCWLWTGTKNNDGYGMTTSDGSPTLVHRISYQRSRGAIPPGMVLDHLCRTRHCFNPEHLEVVTQQENTLRSPITLGSINKAKTECPQGHPYDEANTYIYVQKSPRQCTSRRCRACASAQARARYARKKVSA